MLFALASALAGPLDDCFAEATDAREPYRCAYRVARSSDDYGPVIERVRAELAAHPDHPWAAHTLGSLLTDQGEIDEGVRSFEAARERFDAGSDTLGRVYSRLNLGKEYQHAGKIDQARVTYLEAAQIAAENGRADLEHAARLSLARGYVTAGIRLGEAWALATQVHDEVFPDGAYQTRVLALHVLNRIAQATDRPDERRLYLQRQLAQATEAEDRYVADGARIDLATLAIEQAAAGHRFDEGIVAHVDALLAPIDEANNPWSAAEVPCLQAQARLETGEDVEAIARATTCVEQMEALESPDDVLRASIVLAFAQARLEPEAADRTWSRALELVKTPEQRASLAVERLEVLTMGQRLADLREHLPTALAGLEQLRRARPDRAVQSATTSTQGRFVALAATTLAGSGDPADLQRALELSAIARGAPVDVQLDLDALKASVPEGTALVAYLLPRTTVRGWAAVITSDDVRVVNLAGDIPFSLQIEPFTGLVRDRAAEVSQPARSLYDRLVAPLDLPLGTERVVLVPNGALHHLPFAVLEGPEGPLGLTHDLERVPGLEWWLEHRVAPGLVERPLIVGSAHAEGFADLPYVESEVAQVQGVLGGPELLLDDRATRRAVLGGRRPDWVHLAAHLEIDDRFPEQSALHLGGDDPLTTLDVRGADWTGSTVVLSSCRSSGGRSFGGQQPLGMTRAFVEAGANAVVGSLWPVRDDDAEAFFSAFYAHLGEGRPLGRALRLARRDRVAAGAPPEAWAGIVLVGDGRRVAVEPSGPSLWSWALGILALVGALLGGTWLNRRFTRS